MARQLPNISDRISFRLVVSKYMKCGSISVFAYCVEVHEADEVWIHFGLRILWLTGSLLLLSVSKSLHFFVRYSLFVFVQ